MKTSLNILLGIVLCPFIIAWFDLLKPILEMFEEIGAEVTGYKTREQLRYEATREKIGAK